MINKRSIVVMRRWITAWTPLIALLLMGAFSQLIISRVINCDSKETRLKTISDKEPITELVCLPHIPDVDSILSKQPMQRLGKLPFSELRNRITWSISMLFFALTIIITLVTIYRAINDTIGSFKLLPVIFIVFLPTALVMQSFLPSRQQFDFNKVLLGPTVYRVSPVEPFVKAVVIMAPVALVGIAIAVSLILYHIDRMPVRRPELTVAARASVLARAQKRIRLLLYVGALALVAGTLQASALYTWAMTLLTLPSGSTYFSNATELPQAMGILNGSFYSIFLAGVFVPAIVQLRRQAARLANLALPAASAAERSKWLEEHAIEGTFPRQLVSALAVIAPLLAGGPLVSLLELIAG